MSSPLKRAQATLATAVVLSLMALASPAPAVAERGDAASSTADFLRLNAGAAAAAQGEAYVARSGGVEVLPYNPAGLATMEQREILLQHNQYLLDATSNYIAFAGPFRSLRLAGSIHYLDHGSLTRRTLSNPNGAGTFGADALLVTVGGGIPLNGRLNAGVAMKFFHEQIDNASRTGFGADLGLHFHSPFRWGRYELGIAARNLGPQVRFDRDKEDLPMEFAAGASVLVFRDHLRLSGELALPRNQELDYRAGVELRLIPAFALRAGYNSRNDLDNGLSLGAGFRYKVMALDYAWVPFASIGDAHRIGLTVSY